MQITNKSKKIALSYRSVPTWMVNSAFAASLIFGGLCLFQIAPIDERIAPPELYHSPEFSTGALASWSDSQQGIIQSIMQSIHEKMNFASQEQIIQHQIEYSRKQAELHPFVPPAVSSNPPPPAHAWDPQQARLERKRAFETQIALLNQRRGAVLALLAILSALSAFVAVKLRDRRLSVNADGLTFPTGMLPQLDWRRKRAWNDLSALGLSGKGTETSPRALQIYFNSGGKAPLLTERLTSKDLEQFFHALDQNAPQVIRSPELVAFRHEFFNSSKDPSFTQIWEQELNSHFASTNFVALSPAATLQNGKIKIAMHLSSGGLSAVYLAERNKGMIVVKESVVPAGTSAANREKAREMFQREAKMLMKLNHPKIAKVIDHFQENERDYLLLEYIPGITLREYIRRHGPQKEERVVEWTLQIAGILKYLHEQDPPIIHRDLTPDNLMITPSGDIVLIDFGAANQFLGSATGTIVGKQFYIAPEQFRGKAVPGSDIYSLGGSIFYLLTGVEPEALSTSHPKTASAQISDEMDALVARCTELQETNRFASAAELLIELERLQTKESFRSAQAEPSLQEARSISIKQKEKQPR